MFTTTRRQIYGNKKSLAGRIERRVRFMRRLRRHLRRGLQRSRQDGRQGRRRLFPVRRRHQGCGGRLPGPGHQVRIILFHLSFWRAAFGPPVFLIGEQKVQQADILNAPFVCPRLKAESRYHGLFKKILHGKKRTNFLITLFVTI